MLISRPKGASISNCRILRARKLNLAGNKTMGNTQQW